MKLRTAILFVFLSLFFASDAVIGGSSLIEELKNEGALVLYHDYRSHSMYDWSGNSNHGTGTDLQWTNNGVRFPLTTSEIHVHRT